MKFFSFLAFFLLSFCLPVLIVTIGVHLAIFAMLDIANSTVLSITIDSATIAEVSINGIIAFTNKSNHYNNRLFLVIVIEPS